MSDTAANGTATITVQDDTDRAVWSTAYINGLPDSSFLYIEPGGTKDAEGKTTPRTLRHFPVKDADGKVDVPHVRNALSRIPQSNLPASVKASATAKAQRLLAAAGGGEAKSAPEPPPRENLVRAAGADAYELREAASDGGMPTLLGHFAVFNQWTEIDSFFEGRFLERFQPGAFAKTFSEGRDAMRVLFQHGRDPQIGDKVLGPVEVLEEQQAGAYYEVPLLDTSYNRDLLPGLAAGLYGASFRFRVVKEELNLKPETSDYNPEGIPERTVTEAMVREFGPVTFPAYASATAGLRSLTDEFVVGHVLGKFNDSDPARLRALLDAAERIHADDSEPGASEPTTRQDGDDDAGDPPPDDGGTPEPDPSAGTTSATRKYDDEEWEQWLSWTTLQG
jgi:HK97 family phage prohead protease